MINNLIRFLQWLQTFTWQDWTIIVLAVLLLLTITILVMIVKMTAKASMEFMKVFWNR